MVSHYFGTHYLVPISMATKIPLAEIAWERRLEDISLKEDWEIVLSLECVYLFSSTYLYMHKCPIARHSPDLTTTPPHSTATRTELAL